MRRLAISDIHGEAERLLQVLRAADYQPVNARLFLLGDYIDRGPNSAGVVHIVRDLVEQGAMALKGNHEHIACLVAKGRYTANPHWRGGRRKWLKQGGAQTMVSYNGPIPADVLAWFETLPFYHEEPDCILVHAGLKPGVPLDRQKTHDLLWNRKEFHLGYTGKRVVFGHTPTMYLHKRWAPWYGTDKVCIDTGACCGGVLTLFDLDTHETWTA